MWEGGVGRVCGRRVREAEGCVGGVYGRGVWDKCVG